MLTEQRIPPITDPVPPAQPGLGAKMIRNVLFGGLRYFVVTPIPFVMTPFILHKIGVAGYGTWAVFLALNGLTSLADLGLVGTLSKFVAEYYARRDFQALSRLMNSGLTLFLLLDIIVTGVLWAATPLLTGMLFHGSTVPKAELVLLFRSFQVVIAANILNQLFGSVTGGLQRLDLLHVLGTANVIMNAAFAALFLMKGEGLRGLIKGYVIAAIITTIANYVLVRKLLPGIALNPFQFDRNEARKMFGYSLRFYFTQAAVAVHSQIEKFLLGTLVSVAAVGWYDIASDVALKIRGVISLILTPVMAAASELDALGDELRLQELHYRAHKYLALVGVPAVFYGAAVSSRFVELWLGPNMKIIGWPLSVLLAVNFFNLTTGPGFLILSGRGNLRPGIQSAVVGIVSNVVLSTVLIYKFGFAGAVIGTAGALILAGIFFIAAFHRITRYPLGRVFREAYLKPILFSTLVLAVIRIIHPIDNLSWSGLLVMGLAFGIVFIVSILLSGFFDEYDWNRVERLVPIIRHARRVTNIV
jgi:O-antigen/teichoic acid export membrane protein